MKKTIKDIITIINAKERRWLALFIFFNTLINLADVFAVVCLLVVIKFYTQPASFHVNNIFLAGIFSGKNTVLPVVLLMVMFIIKNIAGHLVYKKQVKFISDVAVRISRQNLSAYLQGTYNDYTDVDSAVFVSSIIHQPTEFAQYVLQSAQQIVTELLLIAFSTTALMMYNARLFMIVFLTMLPAIIILSWLTKKRLDNIKRNIKVVVEQSLQYLNEALKGYVESNIYQKNTFFIQRHEVAQKNVGSHITSIQTTQDMPARFFEVFAILGLLALIVAIKYTTAANNADVVLIGAFIAAAYKIIPSIARIINLSGQVRTYSYTINATMNRQPARQASVAAAPNIKSIAFNNVNFAYKGLKVLEEFSCTIEAGSFVGISGPSGSGKTTVLQLLLGFCRPSSGSILFNGEMVTDEARAACWSRIAYVKQEPFILHASVLNNIVLFENGYDKEHLDEVLAITGLYEVTTRFAAGINEPITEGGKNLSGGQRKRIAIARALYKNADLILLDEPFSELDEASELKILQHFKLLALSGKTVVLITHNPNSFQLCDEVINVHHQEVFQ